jgi:hypothetical protein
MKQGEELKAIQKKLEEIEYGDKEIHIEKIQQLKKYYNFKSGDIMKISCWLTQVKRTAYNMDLISPTALVFYSPKKCTGKSTLMTIIKKVVLSNYQSDVHLRNFSLEKLFSRFRPIELIQDLIITIDEIGWMNKDISADFKSLITDTNEIEIEKKFKDPIFGRKLANFIITTNDEPADLFYTDAHERRLSVIDNFDKIKNVNETELYNLIESIWKSVPIEYAFDTDMLMNINTKRIRSNDNIFEALLNMHNNRDDKQYYTVQSLFVRFREYQFDINKKLIKSYLETSPQYFRKNVSGSVVRYKPLQKLYDDLENDLTKGIAEIIS